MTTETRTDEELNHIIAEWCGWVWKFNGDHEDPEWYWVSPVPDDLSDPPNYCRDLNAVHEAVMRLLNSKPGYWDRAWFWGLHQLVTGIDSNEGWGEVDARSCCDTSNATARERAEALVKVIEAT